jgi:hypothetical protein
MMRVPIENKGQMPLYVAGVMIPPGEIRHFDDDQLPPEFRAPAEASADEVPLDPLLDILKMKMGDVAKGLPDLSDEELDRLEMLEVEGHNRKGVIAAVAEERLRRGELKAAQGGEG